MNISLIAIIWISVGFGVGVLMLKLSSINEKAHQITMIVLSVVGSIAAGWGGIQIGLASDELDAGLLIIPLAGAYTLALIYRFSKA